MLPNKYLNQVQSFLLSGFMSFIMSGIITLMNLGIVDEFINMWFHAWILAFAIAFPTIMLIFPFVRKLAIKIASK